MDQAVEIKNFIFKFCIIYAIGSIAIVVIFSLLDLDHSTGAQIVILIYSAMSAVVKFIKETKRVPNKIEKSKFIWLSLASSYLISIFLAVFITLFLEGARGLSALVSLAEELNMFIIMGAIVVISLFYYAILSW